VLYEWRPLVATPPAGMVPTGASLVEWVETRLFRLKKPFRPEPDVYPLVGDGPKRFSLRWCLPSQNWTTAATRKRKAPMIATAKTTVWSLQMVCKEAVYIAPPLPVWLLGLPLPRGVFTGLFLHEDAPDRVMIATAMKAPMNRRSRASPMAAKKVTPPRKQVMTMAISVYRTPAPMMPSMAFCLLGIVTLWVLSVARKYEYMPKPVAAQRKASAKTKTEINLEKIFPAMTMKSN